MLFLSRLSKNHSLFLKVIFVLIIFFIVKFGFFTTSSPISTKAKLELIVSDVNKREMNNARVSIYNSLKEYEEDKPIEINNWEQRMNHYIFMDLNPGNYYFRVVSSSLDNGSDTYVTDGEIKPGLTGTYKVTLR
jgi:uncharacterized protein (DUF2141 family)